MRGVLPLLVLLVAGSVRADGNHYQTFLIGERALGMGGAATGVADESSAVFYNPAGIALMGGDAVGGNLSINAFDRRRIEDGYGSPAGTDDFVATSRPGVPLFASVVKRIGRRGPDRVRRHAFAISTVNPMQRRLRYEVDVFNPDTRVRESLTVDSERRATWYGPTLALRLSQQLAIGLSAFWVRQRLRHREDATSVTALSFDPARGTYENDTAFVRESLAKLDTHHLVFRLGGLWAPNAHWRVGLMFQPPGIEVKDSARIMERRILADTLASPAYATLAFSDQRGLPGAAPIPWELRIGASYASSERLLFGADVSVVGGVGSRNDPVRRFGDPEPDPETGFVPEPGDHVARDVWRRPVVNLSVGMEAVIAGVVPLRLGVFTDRSAAPDIQGPTDIYQPVDVDRYGATASIGFRSGDYDLSLGAAVLYGRGRGLRTNPFGPSDPDQTYLPTDVEDRTIYFFISGARRAAARIARRIVRTRRRQEASPADPADDPRPVSLTGGSEEEARTSETEAPGTAESSVEAREPTASGGSDADDGGAPSVLAPLPPAEEPTPEPDPLVE